MDPTNRDDSPDKPDAIDRAPGPSDDGPTTPMLRSDAMYQAVLAPEIGETVGPYRILERVGEGGMGVVFVAEQREPFRRRVALKVIKLGMDTREVVARFEAERQALAILDHPYIAKVFEAGATNSGRPYFVMEYIEGDPLTAYCQKNRLPTRERLELAVRVCEGVQHAHQKGIIHRDLKPSNILVQVSEGKTPVPKIIDFGVAKAVQLRLTEKTLFTQRGQLVGTPEYMSPEQAEMSGIDVDTRTDIYSIGAILYELLVGVVPFELKELRQAGLNEIQRVIREIDPPKPSTRLSQLASSGEGCLRREQRDAQALGRQLKGDLDSIVMMALEKDRTRRYGTCNELAADIAAYLGDEPVRATPPTALYRTTKFVRRHRAGVIAGSLLFLLLAAFAATTWILYGSARDSARDARKAELAAVESAEEATRNRRRAEANRVRAEEAAWAGYRAIVRAVQGSLDSSDPSLLREQLDSCYAEHRHWEWHYLRSLIDTSMLTWDAPEEITALRFLSQPNKIAVGLKSGTVMLLDLGDPNKVTRLAGLRSAVQDLREYESSLLGTAEKQVVSWSLPSGELQLSRAYPLASRVVVGGEARPQVAVWEEKSQRSYETRLPSSPNSKGTRHRVVRSTR